MHTEEKGTQKQASNVVADFLEQKTVAILRIYPNFFHSLREDVFVVNNRHRKKSFKIGPPRILRKMTSAFVSSRGISFLVAFKKTGRSSGGQIQKDTEKMNCSP